MLKTVAVANQKGGVGKTTTAVNLAACLAERGREVLLLDMDPQGNATSGLGIDREALELTMYDAVVEGQPFGDLVVETDFEGLSVAPSTRDLAGAEVELANHPEREYRLRDAVKAADLEYDVLLVDCPPSLGLLTVNSLTASDSVLVPVQAEYYALEGVGLLSETIELVQEYLNPKLTVEGILLTMFDARTNLAEQVEEEARDFFGALVYDTAIPRNVRLSEAPSYGEPIVEYAPSSKGAEAYESFAEEFLARQS
ncbi:MAG: ParA family protein [Bradymonadaceae bacterium]